MVPKKYDTWVCPDISEILNIADIPDIFASIVRNNCY